MAVQIVCEIEFVGGPVDGHAETMTSPPTLFVGVTTVARNPVRLLFASFKRLLTGRGRRMATRLAMYELDWDESSLRPRYRYCGTHTVTSNPSRDGHGLSSVERVKVTTA